jgi:hypothetical protein
MFTPDQKNEIFQKYNRYRFATLKNYPGSKLFTLSELKKNVVANASEDETDYFGLLNSVLDAMIYTSENTVEEMIERAEEDVAQRMMNMTEEQRNLAIRMRRRDLEIRGEFDRIVKEVLEFGSDN